MKSLSDTELLNKIKDLCLKKKLTLAVAESVTSGLLQNNFSRAEEAMQFFQGGMTLYNLGQKTRHMNLNPITAESSNCVAADVAEQMALEISRQFVCEIGIGITGYAALIPEKDVSSLYAYAAISLNGKITESKKMLGDKSASLAENQEIYTRKTLELLYKTLQ